MEYQVLGPLQVVSAGSPVPIKRALERRLLAILLSRANTSVSIDVIVEALWGEDLPTSPRGALQTAVSRLRRALAAGGEPHGIETGPESYRLAVTQGQVDSQRFRQAVDASRDQDPDEAAVSLRDALNEWKGAPYSGFEFEDFAQTEIRQLGELRIAALDRLMGIELARGRHVEILAELQGLVAENPLHEELWAHLMVALYRAGRQAEALRAYQDARDVLIEELGIEPGPLLRRVEEAVLRQDSSLDLNLEVPPANLPAVAASTAIPTPLTPLVGRERETSRLVELIRQRRLVSVLGPPGVGKTRLAVAASNEVAGVFADGVRWFALDRASDPLPMVEELVSQLGLAAGAEGALTRLTDWLRGREQLIVLDGCERNHADAAVLIPELLESSPGLRILLSTRQRLGIPAEAVLRVDPLAVPDVDVTDETSPAMDMFRQRLRDATGQTGDDEPDAIARIVRAVQGLPLGIELAAGRIGTASLADIATSLELELGGLEARREVVPQRHQSLGFAIECSWRYLSPEAERVLAALSVFIGPWTLDDAIRLLEGEIDEEVLTDHILDLADRSLIDAVVRTGPMSRAAFSMLDPLRRYASERLRQSGNYEEVRRRHAYAEADAAQRFASAIRSSPRGREGTWFAEHLPDMTAAFEWLLDNDAERALGMALHLAESWGRAQRLTIAGEWLLRAYETAEPTGWMRAESLIRLGWLYAPAMDIGPENVMFTHPFRAWRNRRRFEGFDDDELDRCAGWFLEGIELYERLGQKRHAARGRVWYGWLLANRGDLIGAEEQTRLALEELDESPYDRAVARLLLANTAIAVGADDLALAELAEAEKMETKQEPLIAIFILDTYARLARANRRPAEAFHSYRRALVEHALPSELAGAALLCAELGFLAVRLEDFATAQDEFGKALRVGRLHGMPRVEGMVRIGQAYMCLFRGDYDRAIRYLKNALDTYETLGDPDGQVQVLALRAKLEQRRGADEVAAAYALRGAAATGGKVGKVAISQLLEVLAERARELGEEDDACRILGAADHLRSLARVPRGGSDPSHGTRDQLRVAVGEERFEQLVHAGSGLTALDAVDLAITTTTAR